MNRNKARRGQAVAPRIMHTLKSVIVYQDRPESYRIEAGIRYARDGEERSTSTSFWVPKAMSEYDPKRKRFRMTEFCLTSKRLELAKHLGADWLEIETVSDEAWGD